MRPWTRTDTRTRSSWPTRRSTRVVSTAPFAKRSACEIAGGGDRRSYQQDYANRREALREARADVEQGADIVMVKPAMTYLDVVSDLAREIDVPLCAYHVSGEYAMIKAAGQNGWIDGDARSRSNS